jgi:hypothetical protein
MTTWPSQIPSFPGLTGESRKALDARLRPAGMNRKQEWNVKMCQFNYETLNKSALFLRANGLAEVLSERWDIVLIVHC